MNRPGLADLLPLSPLQEGLLFHARFDGDADGDTPARDIPDDAGSADVYAVQLVLTLSGPLDAAALRAAGEALLARHANLRAGFRAGRSGRPAQLVPHQVTLPWREVDLGGGPAAPGRPAGLDRPATPQQYASPDQPAGPEQPATPDRQARLDRLADLAAAERAERFDLTRPPALRMVLARSTADEHHLVLTSHHILLDGWSTPLLVRELLALYAARGEPAALPPVTPYRDYLSWLLAQDAAAAHAAWDHALDGLQHPTPLAPAAAGGVPGPTAEHVLELDADLTAALVGTARQHGLTLNSVLQGAWAVVLGAATGRADVVFGTTVSGRPAEIPGVENMVGLLINTVPVRVRLTASEPLAQALRRLQSEQADLLGSQHVGLAEIQRRAGLGELFDTLVVFENQPRELDDAEVGGLRVTAVQAHDATHYPLTVVATPGERLSVALHHRTDLVPGARAAALGGQLHRVLAAVAADPQLPVGRVPVASEAERRTVLEWGSCAASGPPSTLPALFAAQVARTPDAPAVRAEGRELDYAALDRAANRLAHELRGRGVGPERVVGLALPRSIEAVVAFLAVQKAGGVCLPLDLEHPADRIAAVLADAAPVLVLTAGETALPAGLPTLRVEPVVPGGPGDTDPGAPELDEAPDRAAYVVFTSGSTGRPKGVVVTHAGIADLVGTARDRFAVGPDSRVAQFAALSFDIAVWELTMALLSGGCLVVVPARRRTDVDALLEFARDERLSVLAIPPSLLAVVPADARFPDGVTLLVGSETVPAELVRRWCGRVRFVVAYGVTESTVNQTLWTAPPGWAGRTVPIGRPDPGVRAHVLGPGLLPQPPGVPGHLYLGGDGLARGYLGRPDLTAERFVADPHGAPGSRMYRTGDLARWTAGGDLEFLGRADDQVQIRGFRVEPGEVESVLLRVPGVAAAAVLARTDGPGPVRLVAYVVPTPGSAPDPTRWRRHLAADLPEYMVPSALVALTALPRTPNGKLDRAALPDPAPATGAAAGGDAPRTAAEELLARLVGEILGVEGVGITDDFFTLGGDSISSIVLVSRARREGLALTPRQVFAQRTVAGLARAARPVQGQVAEDPSDALGRVPITPIVAWLREHDGVIDGHNQSMLVGVPAGAGQQRLAAVLQAVLDHHAMLRARLLRGRDGWEFDVPPPGSVRAAPCLTRVHTGGVDPSHEQVAAELDAAKSRLDPDAGVMVQAVWFDAGPERAGRLLCVVHHLVVDGVSWRILVPDLAAAWAAVVAGRPVELEPVATAFRSWARGLTEEARRPGREAELAGWRAELEPEDPALSPVSIDRARDTAASTRHLTLDLPAHATAPLLTDVPAAFHAGVNDVLLTALALAVARWRERRGRGGGTGVLINLEGHGREDVVENADVSRTVGWFTSTFPVRLDPGEIDLDDALRGGPAAGVAVKRVKERLRALPDKGVGFGLLRYLNERTRPELAALRWPQIGFNYLGRFATASQTPDPDGFSALSQALSGSVDAEMPVAYVLEINVITRDRDTGPELSVTWSWPAALLPESDVRELAESWFTALDALVRHTRGPGAGGRTPSDLLVELDQDEIDEFEDAF